MRSRKDASRPLRPELDLLDLLGAELAHRRVAPAGRSRDPAPDGAPLLGVLVLHLEGLSEWRLRRGDAAATALLHLVAARMAAQLRTGDRCFSPTDDSLLPEPLRGANGGGCLLRDLPHGWTAQAVAERLRRHLGGPWCIGPARLVLRASIGMAVGPPADGARLLEEAQRALHGACRQPGGVVPFRASALGTGASAAAR